MLGARLLSVRPGEGRLVVALAAMFAVVEAGRGLAEVGADTLVVDRFGAGVLPYLYIALGVVSLLVALAYGAALGRLPRRPFFAGLLGLFAAILVIERLVLGAGVEAAIHVIYVSVAVVTALLTTIAWTVAAGTLDARQAKRLFPLCTSAAIAGSFVGGILAGPIARLVGSENLIVVYAGIVLVAGVPVAGIAGRFGRHAGRPVPVAISGRGRPSIAGELRAGFDTVRDSPLMRLVAVAYVLFAILLFSANYPYLQAFGAAYEGRPEELAAALGLVSAAVTAASFVVSFLLANRIYARFGVVTAALVLPLVYLGGFGLWLVQFNLATAVAVRFAYQVTQRSVSNAAWSALYAVLPPGRRPQAMAFIDGVPGQIGMILSGVLLLVVARLLDLSQIFVVGAVAAALCAWVVIRIRRRYGEALIRTLRSGLAEQVLEGGPGLASMRHDTRVIDELVVALRDLQPGARRLAANLLGRLGDRTPIPRLVEAAADREPEVRAAAIAALTALDPEGAAREVGQAALGDPAPLVRVAAVRAIAPPELSAEDHTALVADPDPAVRAEVALACAANGADDEAIEIVGALLADERPAGRVAGLAAVAARPASLVGIGSIERLITDDSPDVRAAAATALAAVAMARDGAAELPPSLVAALDDPAVAVRRAAADALRSLAEAADRTAPIPGAGPDVRAPLAAVLEEGPDRARDAALAALIGVRSETHARVRQWAVGQAERAAVLRRRSVALAAESAESADAADAGGPVRYLGEVLEQRRRVIERRLLAAIAALGFPDADGPIRRSLGSSDPDVRAQAIEAVDSIGDRQLGRAVVRLLDADATAPGRRPDGPPDAVLRELTEDGDPWIRRLAMRAIGDRLAGEWRALGARVASDPDPIVQAALSGSTQHGGPPMPDTDQTLGELDRMLFLRRVPLFGGLEPEDLQRLAALAIERLYAPDEALVREGDTGDELVVIVEGDVRVVQGEGSDMRYIKSYEAGDHVGELAILRRQPRSATVLAGIDGVRGLVISGESLRAILAERPDAAMAMLATLAERIGKEQPASAR
jgi:ATP/ADP translocase/HEAT repeat protein